MLEIVAVHWGRLARDVVAHDRGDAVIPEPRHRLGVPLQAGDRLRALHGLRLQAIRLAHLHVVGHPARAEEQDVPAADLHPLLLRDRLDHRRVHADPDAGLEPLAQVAWDVQQHAATVDAAALRPEVDAQAVTVRQVVVLQAVVVAVLAVAHVAQAVPLAGTLQVEIVQAVVAAAAVREHHVLDRPAPALALRHRRATRHVQRQVEVDRDAALHQPGGGLDLLRADEVHRAVVVILAKDVPRVAFTRGELRQFVVQRQTIWSGHLAPPLLALSRRARVRLGAGGQSIRATPRRTRAPPPPAPAARRGASVRTRRAWRGSPARGTAAAPPGSRGRRRGARGRAAAGSRA